VDRIIIEALDIDTIIGVHPFEHQFHQRLQLDLELWWDIRAAASTDDLKLTLDYAAICKRLREYALSHQVLLVETLAERMALLLHHEFAVSRVLLHLRKPSALAEAKAVGVCIERQYI